MLTARFAPPIGKGRQMTNVQHRISMLLFAGALAVATIAAIPATAAVAADTPGTGTCTTTITGPLTGALTAAVGTTCLTSVTLHGAITVNPGAALSVVDSTIYGAITTNGASAFTFCNSSTVGGAISVATSTGFILIGDGRLVHVLNAASGGSHPSRKCGWGGPRLGERRSVVFRAHTRDL